MTKKEAVSIVESIQIANLRGWLKQAVKCGRVYYLVNSVSRNGDRRSITLATIACGNVRPPHLDFFWPSVVPQYSTDDPGVEARALLGGHSASLDVAAKVLSFDFKRRAFVISGGGMDMVYALLSNLGTIAGVSDEAIQSIGRTSMDRT